MICIENIHDTRPSLKSLKESRLPKSALPPPVISTGRAKRILKILNEFKGAANIRCVIDVGCGYGDIALELTKLGYRVIGTDIYAPALHKAKALSKDVELILSSVDSICMSNCSCDLIVCYGVLEHLSLKSIHQSLSEAFRILRKGGMLFLVVPNRFWILEPHYKLPFLSWLPKKMANIYVRLFKKSLEFDVHPFTCIEISKLLKKKGFRIINVTPYIAKNFPVLYEHPEYLSLTKYNLTVFISKLLLRLPLKLSDILINLFFETLSLLCIKEASE